MAYKARFQKEKDAYAMNAYEAPVVSNGAAFVPNPRYAFDRDMRTKLVVTHDPMSEPSRNNDIVFTGPF